jgi:hypothetical protein
MRASVPILLVVAALAILAVACRREPAGDKAPAQTSKTVFVFVKIRNLWPKDREKKCGDPLDASLKSAGLGEVTGGGSQMSAPDAEGHRTIVWIGLDVELADLDRGLPFLKKELARLGAPPAQEPFSSTRVAKRRSRKRSA